MTLEELELKKEELLKSDKTYENFLKLCVIEKIKTSLNSTPNGYKVEFDSYTIDVNNLEDLVNHLENSFDSFFNEIEDECIIYKEKNIEKEMEME